MRALVLFLLVASVHALFSGRIPCRYSKFTLAKCIFARYDTNRDGKLDRSEIKRIFNEHKQDLPKKLSIDRIFENCDKDGDKKISIQEGIHQRDCDTWCPDKIRIGRQLHC
jgi:hypothetical protein